MEKIYTENALIRYIYKESDFFERLEVEYALESDKGIRALYNKLINAYRNLPKALFFPSQNVLDSILGLSRSGAIEARG